MLFTAISGICSFTFVWCDTKLRGAGSSSGARPGFGTRYQKASSTVSAAPRRFSVTVYLY